MILSKIKSLLKKHFPAIIFSAVFIFIVILTGNIISVITSREILDPLSIKIDGLSDSDLSTVKAFATLSRAGNVTNLTLVPGKNNEWNNVNQAFIKKISIRLSASNLDRLSLVSVNIGDSKYSFSKKDFLIKWKKVNVSKMDLFLYDPNGSSEYFVYEAPQDVKSKPLNFPVATSLFASINFAGSEKLIQKPIISSVKMFILVEILLFIYFLFLAFVTPKNSIIAENNNTILHKKEFIIFGLSVFLTSFLLLVLNMLILYFYKPDTTLIVVDAFKIYRSYYLSGFLPEPVERMQFLFSVLSSPFLLLISYRLMRKYIMKKEDGAVNSLYYISSIIFSLIIFSVIYIGLSVSNFLYINDSYFFSSSGKYIYTLLLFPVCIYSIYLSKFVRRNRAFDLFVYCFSGLLIISIFFVHIFSINSEGFVNNVYATFHFNPLFYPMSQVIAGKIILANLTSVYGLFPVFLSGIFWLIGLSVLKFTLIMGLLLSLSYLFIFLFLRRMVKSGLILFLGFSTMVYYFLAPNSNPYLQYYPIRIFFPTLILLLVSLYFNNKNRLLYYLIFVLSAFAVLWNLDSGLIVFISWIATLCYSELFGCDVKVAIKKISVHLAVGFLVLGMVILSYVAYYYLKKGILINLTPLWQYQKLFLSGYGMIPMPFPHIWLLVAMIFLVGLLLSVVAWYNKRSDVKTFSIFYLSIMGIGLFSYYQGRSHDMVFFAPLYSVLMLVVIFADYVYNSFGSNRDFFGNKFLLLILLFFLFSSPINLVYNSPKYYQLVKIGIGSVFDKASTSLSRNVSFIKNNTVKGERVIILSEDSNDGLYYGESGTYAAPDLPSSTDIYFNSEVDYLADFLRCNNDYKLFISPIANYNFYDKKINNVIKNNYIMIGKNDDGMALYQSRGNTSASCFNSIMVY